MSSIVSPTLRHVLLWSIILGVSFMFIDAVSAILLPFVLGAVIAYLMDPLADRLERCRMPRGVASALLTVASFSVVVLVLATALPLIGKQLVRLMHVLPDQLHMFYTEHLATVQQWLNHIPAARDSAASQNLANLPGVAGGLFTDLMDTVFASGAAALNVFSLLLITPVVTFYLLRDWDRIIAIINDLLPRAHAATIRQQLDEMDAMISGFLRGQLLVCSVLAVFYIIGLSIMGLNFSVVIGAAAGFLIIIPYAGWFAAASVGMVIAVMQFDSMTTVGIIAAIFLAGQVIEGYFLTPKLVGDRVGLHPVWIIFGMLAGAVLLGFVGVLLAIPLTAVVGVLIRFTLERYKQSELYLGDGQAS